MTGSPERLKFAQRGDKNWLEMTSDHSVATIAIMRGARLSEIIYKGGTNLADNKSLKVEKVNIICRNNRSTQEMRFNFSIRITNDTGSAKIIAL